MKSPAHITIAGGGLAGLTLGIALRQQDVPVTVWEAGRYPRHRVCGEFIHGTGVRVLERMGLLQLLKEAGAFEAQTAMFACGGNHSPARQLPEPALCLSRHLLDDLLAKEFKRRGGELRENARWASAFSPGTVRAAGRRPRATEGGYRWFGLKIHARSVKLAADLEMHVSQHCYVGMNRINGGAVNVCGLFRAREQRAVEKTDSAGATPSLIRGFLRGEAGSALRDRVETGEFDDDSFCSVAGLSLKPQRAQRSSECCIGDALTMIPPVTGNGMSMAFESARIAAEPLADFSRGRMPWDEARRHIAQACDAAFAQRLGWARLLQWLMFSPLLRSPLGALLLRSDLLWSLMYRKTR